MRVYIAGPMTGLPEFNYPAFGDAATRWRAAGHDALSPAENFNGDTTRDYREYIKADILMLARADAIALLPGWEKSRGARFELHAAQMMGLAVFDAVTLEPLSPATLITSFSPPVFGSVLQEAESIVNGARQSAYGHPLDDFSKTAQMWSPIFADGVVNAEKVALAMICVKMSRLLNTPAHHDSQVDIAGYTLTYAMVRQERARRAGKV